MSPAVTFLIVLVIGIVAGLLYDRVAGPGWLSRQVAGKRRGMVTSSLVGIAGAFIGYHLALLARLAMGGYGGFIGAVIGAAVILYAWRMAR